MSSKRALVVDDSKSARAFLVRILERHEIEVDAAESAEAALEYLARHKPDVIFMDHMMPGMDGFQAVQTIKNNPRTSAIPILMYTSQEGDLYLGQARALGAEGVLPKQIKQSDVTKLLFQLRLVTDRRGEEPATFARLAQDMANNAELTPANESAIVVDVAQAVDAGAAGTEITKLLPQMSLEIRAGLARTIQEEIGALRSFVSTTLDSQHERLQGDLAAALQPAPRAPELDIPTMVPERRSGAAFFGVLALLATIAAAAMSWLWWQQGGEIAALRTDLQAAYAEVEALRARPQVVSVTPPVAVASDVDAAVETETSVDTETDGAIHAVGEAGIAGATGGVEADPAVTAVDAQPALPPAQIASPVGETAQGEATPPAALAQ